MTHDPEPREQDDASADESRPSNQGESAQDAAEGADDAPGRDDGSPQG